MGGKARAANLSAARRQEIGQKAIATRWKGHIAKRKRVRKVAQDAR